MKSEILGDKKKSNFDDNLADYVNEIFDKMPDKVPEQTTVPENVSDKVSYDLDYFSKLDIESFAYIDYRAGSVIYLPFSQSQQRIMGSGYQRHLSFQEQVGLYLLGLENKIPAHLTHLVEIVNSMSVNYFEWCNQAYTITINGKVQNFEICEGVTRLDFDGTKYDAASLQFSGSVRCFSGPILKQGVNVIKDLKDSFPELVEYFFTRKFEDLPQKIQENNLIWVPEPNKIVPVNRGIIHIGFDVDGDVETQNRESSSRGVRVK
ncbi:hypothetical protein HZA97_01160 [Candidatus Woesearchaeota archaeon]|nr:hypothetical protein [Candidatus Woesearchaeota archaeon]